MNRWTIVLFVSDGDAVVLVVHHVLLAVGPLDCLDHQLLRFTLISIAMLLM